MSWLQLIDALSCALIFLGCINVTFLAGRKRKGGHRMVAYELHRFGYALLGAGAAAMLIGMLPTAAHTVIGYQEPPWQGVVMRVGVASFFAGRAVRTIFGGDGCLLKR